MVGYIVERLLIEKADGKPLVLNVSWLFFTLNRFVRDEMIQIAIEDELQQITEEVPESYSGWYKRCNPISPEDILIGKDLREWIQRDYGDPYLLFVSGFIGKADLMKLTESGYLEINKNLAEIKKIMLED